MEPKYSDSILEGGLDNDVVIPVIGPTKAGKSSFLNSLIGSDKFEVGRALASCTTVVASHVVPKAKMPTRLHLALGERRIVLLDTPGFDSTYLSDEEVLYRIAEWLAVSYRKGMRVGGVLYLHDIARDDSVSFSRSLKLLSKLCGSRAMDQIIFVTTKWDRLSSAKEGIERVHELRQEYWSKMLDLGATVSHVQHPSFKARVTDEHKDPWEIVHDIIISTNVRKTGENRYLLQIQDEIIYQKRFLPETEAGRELRMSLEALLENAKDLRRRAREDAKAGRPTASLQKRQEDIEKLTAQLKAMKPPGLSLRFMRVIGMRVGG